MVTCQCCECRISERATKAAMDHCRNKIQQQQDLLTETNLSLKAEMILALLYYCSIGDQTCPTKTHKEKGGGARGGKETKVFVMTFAVVVGFFCFLLLFFLFKKKNPYMSKCKLNTKFSVATQNHALLHR